MSEHHRDSSPVRHNDLSGEPPHSPPLRPEDMRRQFVGGATPRLRRSESFTTAEEEKRHHLLWSLMRQYLGNDKKSLQTDIVQHIECVRARLLAASVLHWLMRERWSRYTLCRTRLDFTKFHGFQGTAHR